MLAFGVTVLIVLAYLFGYDHGKKMAFHLMRQHIGKRDLARAIDYEEAAHRGQRPDE